MRCGNNFDNWFDNSYTPIQDSSLVSFCMNTTNSMLQKKVDSSDDNYTGLQREVLPFAVF